MMQLKGCNSYSTISENKQPNAEDLIDIFSKEDTDDWQAHEKMLNITNYLGNENQNYNELLPHTG